MSKAKKVEKTVLNTAEQFYLTNKRHEDVNLLAEDLECSVDLVKAFLNTLPPVAEIKPVEVKTKEKTRVEKLYGNNGKGAIVSTPAASEYNDATHKKGKTDQSGFIHKIK